MSKPARCDSVKNSWSAYLAGRCKGVSNSSVQIPCRSGSPQGAFGAGAGLEPSDKQRRLAELTRSAYAALIGGDKSGALELYRKTLSEFPEDGVCRAMVGRLAA